MPRPRRIINVTCGVCGKNLEKPRWRVNEKKKGVFCCSKNCEYKRTSQINSIRKKYPQEGFQRGHKLSTGKKNKNWKGNGVGYSALHDWVNRVLGKPTICEICLKDNLYRNKIHWANKSGKYKRIKKDWIRLCSSCHKKYDKHLKSTPLYAYKRKIVRLL